MAQTISSLPGNLRVSFADSNWVQITLPAGAEQLDVAFEDANGDAVLGSVMVGVWMSESSAPQTYHPKVAAYSFRSSATRRCPDRLSVALGNNHHCSIIVV